MNKFLFPFSLIFFLLGSCAKTAGNRVDIYNNDFEGTNTIGITNSVVSTFNGNRVLGNYNNGGFDLSISNLPAHDIIEITFDLYIHDSWEGVQSAASQTNGPDIWQMLIDNKIYINTTFANFDCIPGNFCPPQSYPADYPSQSNNPKTGAFQTELPGFCSESGNQKGTTLYKISKTLSHSKSSLTLSCLDMLKQKNSTDPKCDESWSVDNIKIKAISLN